ncbi:MAG: hypothetical protein LBT33_05475 [Spirochaetia bacterium]|jgi:hypothetical protein|nr:hypothetical protein [Spirochaetia bacterium]
MKKLLLCAAVLGGLLLGGCNLSGGSDDDDEGDNPPPPGSGWIASGLPPVTTKKPVRPLAMTWGQRLNNYVIFFFIDTGVSH